MTTYLFKKFPLTYLDKTGKQMIEQQFLRMEDVSQYLGMTKRNIYNLEKNDPTFPKKIVLGKRCVGFTKNSIQQWLTNKSEVKNGKR